MAAAVEEATAQLEATGSPLVTDGDLAKSSFATYTLEAPENLKEAIELFLEEASEAEIAQRIIRN